MEMCWRLIGQRKIQSLTSEIRKQGFISMSPNAQEDKDTLEQNLKNAAFVFVKNVLLYGRLKNIA